MIEYILIAKVNGQEVYRGFFDATIDVLKTGFSEAEEEVENQLHFEGLIDEISNNNKHFNDLQEGNL